MDDAKVSQLIEEVRRRPVIWDKSVNENRCKQFLGKEWDKVAANIRVAKLQAQTKWKNLVVKFKSEHRQVQLHRSGDGLEDRYVSSWPYYQTLSFLASSVLPNKSTGNLDDLFDVKPSTTTIEIQGPNSKEVEEKMSKKQKDMLEELLRLEKEKHPLLEKPLMENESVSSLDELDRNNMAFLLTLLPTMREVPKKDILLCRNDMSWALFRYAFPNATWKSINDGRVGGIPATPNALAPSRRKRQLAHEEADDCQIVNYFPARPDCQPKIKKEVKYKPSPKERELENSNDAMMPLGYNNCAYTHQQQGVPYPGQHQLHSVGNQWYNQDGIPRPIAASSSYTPMIVNPQFMMKQIPPGNAFPAMAPGPSSREMQQMSAAHNYPSMANLQGVQWQFPPNAAFPAMTFEPSPMQMQQMPAAQNDLSMANFQGVQRQITPGLEFAQNTIPTSESSPTSTSSTVTSATITNPTTTNSTVTSSTMSQSSVEGNGGE